MRFGTRTELGSRWTARASRPTGRQRIGYSYRYLSVALNPQTGEVFALILPDMRGDSFQAFINEFKRFIGKSEFVRLITDGAAAHRSRKLKIADSIQIEHLPPYSPELNPVERLFKELRQPLKNRVFDSIEEVEAAIVKAVAPYFADGSRVRKLTFYGWLHSTPT